MTEQDMNKKDMTLAACSLLMPFIPLKKKKDKHKQCKLRCIWKREKCELM